MSNNIKKIRNAKGITQTELGDSVNASLRMIAHLEAGTRQLTDTWMVKIAKALGVKPSELLDDGTPTTLTANRAEQGNLLYTAIELAAQKSRDFPNLPVSLIVSVALSVYSAAQSGKLPEAENAGKKKLGHVLSLEAQKLIDYELGKSS